MELSGFELNLLRQGTFTLGKVQGRMASVGQKLLDHGLVKLHFYTNFEDAFLVTEKGAEMLRPIQAKVAAADIARIKAIHIEMEEEEELGGLKEVPAQEPQSPLAAALAGIKYRGDTDAGDEPESASEPASESEQE